MKKPICNYSLGTISTIMICLFCVCTQDSIDSTLTGCTVESGRTNCDNLKLMCHNYDESPADSVGVRCECCDKK
jgi:hypothetical protein